MNRRLGIMSVENPEYPPFGKQRFFFEDMIYACPDIDFDIFYFSPLSWNEESNLVNGYHFKFGKWIPVEASIPFIIYDRAFSKNEKEKKHILRCRDFLSSSGNVILNPFRLVELLNDKVNFHNFLLAHNIPTLPTSALDDLERNLQNGNKMYLKPRFGSKGEGIFVAEKCAQNYILYDNFGKSQSFDFFVDLYKTLYSRIDFPDRYFIQPEAEIVRHHSSPFDIRVIVQNYGNKYHVTGLGARLGGKDSMTSNLNAGGEGLPVDDLDLFFKKAYGFGAEILKMKMEQLCLNTCKVLEEKFGPFCEIGFDILCTKNFGPIIIEGNAKPSRWIFNMIADYLESQNRESKYFKNLRQETVKVPLIYSKYLLDNISH